MPDAKRLHSWGRQAWWATLLGGTFTVVASIANARAAFTGEPDAVLGANVITLVSQVLLFAGVVGFLVYGWFAGLGSIRRKSRSSVG